MTLSSDDITEIQQLYSAYCFAVDDRDGEAFCACFTADGSLGGAGGGPIQGAEALRQFAEQVRPGMRHLVTNVHADGDGDRARGRAYLVAYTATGGSTSLLSTGGYHDDLQRVGGRWLFAARQFTPDG